MKLPCVVLIGRTNAGKSTLFNRLTETSQAIVSPQPNTTRDQNHGIIYWKGQHCSVIDTGGLDMTALDPLDQAIQDQVQRAVALADVLLVVIDGQTELQTTDLAMAKQVQQLERPVVVCLNKIDSARFAATAVANFARLPFADFITCSAKSGSGTAELLDRVFSVLPKATLSSAADSAPNVIRLAIIGRPNVGKSTLFNAIIGEDQVIVSPLPHTTRDTNDTIIKFGQDIIRLIDTAGIRRQSRVGQDRSGGGTVERLSVNAALATLRRADVVLFVIEAQQRIHRQDKALLDVILSSAKPLALIVNKWDLIPHKGTTTINNYTRYFRSNLNILPQTPILFISAQQRQRTNTVIETAIVVYQDYGYEMPQAVLNTIVQQLLRQQPKQRRRVQSVRPKKPLIIKELKQIGIRPPRFALSTPRPKNLAPALLNIIERSIRDYHSYAGVPLYIEVCT